MGSLFQLIVESHRRSSNTISVSMAWSAFVEATRFSHVSLVFFRGLEMKMLAVYQDCLTGTLIGVGVQRLLTARKELFGKSSFRYFPIPWICKCYLRTISFHCSCLQRIMRARHRYGSTESWEAFAIRWRERKVCSLLRSSLRHTRMMRYAMWRMLCLTAFICWFWTASSTQKNRNTLSCCITFCTAVRFLKGFKIFRTPS